jgi:hypothetical protein
MGYGIHVYAVDFDALLALPGSDAGRALADRLAPECDEIDGSLGTDPGTALGALRELMSGEKLKTSAGPEYAYALELVCRAKGRWLENARWSAMRGSWFDAVDAALAKAGADVKLTSAVFYAGPPIRTPWPDDFPSMGRVQPAAVGPMLETLERALAAMTGDEAEAVREVVSWLRDAARDGRGLATFYY